MAQSFLLRFGGLLGTLATVHRAVLGDGWKGQALVIYVYVPDAEDWKVRLSYGLLP